MRGHGWLRGERRATRTGLELALRVGCLGVSSPVGAVTYPHPPGSAVSGYRWMKTAAVRAGTVKLPSRFAVAVLTTGSDP